MMTIEKGIPIPEPKSSEWGLMTKAAKSMEVGDSVAVNTKSKAYNLVAKLKMLGAKSTMRRMPDDMYRVWRTA